MIRTWRETSPLLPLLAMLGGTVFFLINGYQMARQIVYEHSFNDQVDAFVLNALPTDCTLGENRFYIRAKGQQMITQCLGVNETKPGETKKFYVNDVGDAALEKGKWLGDIKWLALSLALFAVGFFSFKNRRTDDVRS